MWTKFNAESLVWHTLIALRSLDRRIEDEENCECRLHSPYLELLIEARWPSSSSRELPCPPSRQHVSSEDEHSVSECRSPVSYSNVEKTADK